VTVGGCGQSVIPWVGWIHVLVPCWRSDPRTSMVLSKPHFSALGLNCCAPFGGSVNAFSNDRSDCRLGDPDMSMCRSAPSAFSGMYGVSYSWQGGVSWSLRRTPVGIDSRSIICDNGRTFTRPLWMQMCYAPPRMSNLGPTFSRPGLIIQTGGSLGVGRSFWMVHCLASSFVWVAFPVFLFHAQEGSVGLFEGRLLPFRCAL